MQHQQRAKADHPHERPQMQRQRRLNQHSGCSKHRGYSKHRGRQRTYLLPVVTLVAILVTITALWSTPFVQADTSEIPATADQTDQITYGFTQDANNPLMLTAVAYPDFTSNNVTIATAQFTFLVPEGVVLDPAIPDAPTAGSFTNINGVWEALKLTPSVWNGIGQNEADLEGYDLYQVTLQNSPSVVTSANTAIPLFSFELTADCSSSNVRVLSNDEAIQQAIVGIFGNVNNQMSASVDDGAAADLYTGNDNASASFTCPLLGQDQGENQDENQDENQGENQGQSGITYSFTQDANNPLHLTAVAYPDFTSNNVTIATAQFTFLVPEGVGLAPAIPDAPTAGSFTNINGVWEALKLTPSVWNGIGQNAADLAGYDLYQVTLQNSPSVAANAGTAIPLFSFELTADCGNESNVRILNNDENIQQAIVGVFGNVNNQMSVSVDDEPAADLYTDNDNVSAFLPCPILSRPEIVYGFTQDANDPLLITAVAIPDFTSSNVTLTTGQFTFLLPQGTTTAPVIPETPNLGKFTDITGEWDATRLTPGGWNNQGNQASDLQGQDLYQVTLQNSPEITTNDGVPIPLFSFRLPNDCDSGDIIILTNDNSIQQAILDDFGNANNQMSMSVNDAPARDLYVGHDNDTAILRCLLDPKGVISGLVFDDQDEDGIRDGVDNGLAGVEVKLLDDNDSEIASVNTNAIGLYEFDDVEPGTYTVQVVAPAGKVFSPQDVGINDNVDSDVDASGLSNTLTIAADDDIAVDAGLIPEGTRSFTFEASIENQDADTLGDAVQTTTGAPLNFGYEVVNTGDQPIEWRTLNDNVYGNLTNECNLPTTIPVAGSAMCTIMRNAADAPNGTMNTGSATIFNTGTANDDGWYITNDETGIFSGRVFNDKLQDGLQDAIDTGIAGIQVRLLDIIGNEIATTVTAPDNPGTPADEAGTYQFTGVTPDQGFRIEFVVPNPDSYITLKDEGNDDTIDSDANPTSGRTDIVNVGAGQTLGNIDAGLYDFLQSKPATLGDKVWEDLDGDGIQDAGEPGVPDVTVQLLTPSGTVLETTTTDANGMYLFTGLIPDSYKVRFVLPSGYDAFTDKDAGVDEAADSDADQTTGETDVIILGLSETNIDVDAGLVRYVSIGNLVWEDLNADGIQDAGEPGIADVTATLYEVGNTTPLATDDTDSNGLYGFTDLHPGEYYVVFEKPVGYEFTDRDEGGDDTVDSDANPNSGPDFGSTDSVVIPSGADNDTLDAGLIRPGSIGDTVWLDENNDGIQDAGEQGFPGVVVNLLDENGNEIATTTTDANGNYNFPVLPGTYIIEVEEPNNYVLSPQDVGGDDNVDSDPNPSTGRTDPITVQSGEDIDNVDAGLGTLGTIGDLVWSDTNGDGIQDSGEPGIDDVTVTLFDGDGNLVATTTTGNGGQYIFDNLPADDYQVVVSIPPGFFVSPQDAGGDDDVDSDINSSGTTSVFPLALGEDIDNVDAGLVPEQRGIVVEKSTNGEDADTPTGLEIAIGAVVTWEYVVTNIGNVNLESITVIDDQEGNITSACPPAKVAFLAIGDSFTCVVTGTATLGQYRNEVTVEGFVENLSGETVTDTDVSHYIGIGADLSIEKRDNPDPLDAGDSLFYTFVYTNAGPSDAINVVIEDTLPAGILFNEMVSENPAIGLPTPIWTLGQPLTLRWTIPFLAAGDSGEFVIHVDTDPSLEGTTIENTVTIDSDTPDTNPDNNEDTEPTDFRIGGVGNPTAIELLSFTTNELPSGGTLVRWVTGSEIDTAGFDLYRTTGEATSFDENSAAHVTEGVEIVGSSVFGGEYTFVDNSAVPGVVYTYWLLETEINGTINTYGPAGASIEVSNAPSTEIADTGSYSIFLPTVRK
ncbi:MAG: SdrD B-like domain-containing protein [Chloroflexota bacterium]